MVKNKKNPPSFEYLKDGHDEAAVERWSERLKASPTEVLDACEKAVVSAETVGEAEALYAKDRARALVLLREFLSDLNRHTQRLPIPKSIFVGDAERKPAYAEICRVLGITETFKRELSALTVELMGVESLLSRRKRAHNEASRCLSNVGAATRRVAVKNAFFSAHASLRVRLNAAGEQAVRLYEQASVLEGLLNGFYGDVVADFCLRVEKTADMANDGASCNPSGLIRLCGELREATEVLIRRLEKR